MRAGGSPLDLLRQDVIECRRCPRLREHCAKIASEKRRAYMSWEYWGKPVPGFGDPRAKLLIIGLAPAAHGANRTGRMFTGDRSGDLLYKVLYDTGFASQPLSRSRDDELILKGAYVTAVARCAPPGNKPAPNEIQNCREYLEREMAILSGVKAVVALGRIAFDGYLAVLRDRGLIRSRAAFVFAHNRKHRTAPGQPLLISSYHPSRQNTSTGKLTEKMLRQVFQHAWRSTR